MTKTNETWYIVKQQDNTCEIINVVNEVSPTEVNQWGPFRTQQEALAKRVGLIRAKKCQPQ